MGCGATESAAELGVVMKPETLPTPSDKNRILNSATRETVRAFLLSLAVTMLLAIGFNQTLHLDQSLIREKNHSVVTDKALAVAAQIESELNSDVYLANGLAALVIAAPDLSSSSIDTALQVVHSSSPNVKNIGLAPGNRISHIYPLAGNEKALGLYYPDVPDQWRLVKEAIDRKNTVLAGPIKLRQGGYGLVSRTPVFLPNGNYWGMLSLVIDSDLLLERAKKSAEKLGLGFSLRGKDGMGERGEVFFGSPDFFASQSALLSIHVPGGSWQMAAQPIDPGESTTRYQQWRLLGWAGCALVGLMCFLYLRGRQRVNSSERKFRSILETTPDGVVVISDLGLIEVFNPGAEAMFGYAARELVGHPVKLLMSEADAQHHDDYVARAQHHEEARNMAKGREIQGLRKDGSLFPIEVKVKGVEIDGHRVHVGILRDITERQMAQQQLLEMATQDALTGAANRRSLMEFLQESLDLSVRHLRPLCVLMIDADHFKSINDRYGHPAGDQVLIRLSNLSRECLRKTDKFGRLGGEEFLVVLPETGREQAQLLASRLLQTIASTTVEVEGQDPIRFTVSIGIAALSDGCTTAEEMLKRADVALYQAKEGGRNRLVMG